MVQEWQKWLQVILGEEKTELKGYIDTDVSGPPEDGCFCKCM